MAKVNVLETVAARALVTKTSHLRKCLMCLICCMVAFAFSLAVSPINAAPDLRASSTRSAQITPTLYIFKPSYIKAHIMQKRISRACPELQVIVFAKAKDFRKQMQIQEAGAVISVPPVLSSLKGYKTRLEGKRSGLNKEPYFLVSVDETINPSVLSGKKIGVVDLLGRNPMASFVQKLLGDVSIKRVSKAEDLLPLLSFNAVDALFISESDLADLKQKTQLQLKTSAPSISVGLSSLFIKTSSSSGVIAPSKRSVSKVTQCVMSFDPSINKYFAVNQWSSKP